MDCNVGPGELTRSIGVRIANGAVKPALTSTRGIVSIDVCGWVVLVATPLRVFIGDARVIRRANLVHMCLLNCRKYFLQPGQNCKWRSDIVFSERG